MNGPLKISVPGKIMLAGEYTVLEGGPCIASTTNHRMQLQWTPELQGGIRVASDLWAEESFAVVPGGTYPQPLLNAVASLFDRESLRDLSGLIHVDCGLRIQDGVGSSSAFRLGLAVLAGSLAGEGRPQDWLRSAIRLQQLSQPKASGYDCTVQLHGGCLLFTMGSAIKEKSSLQKIPALTETLRDYCRILVGGGGAPTPQLIRDMSDWFSSGTRWARFEQASQDLVEHFRGFQDGDPLQLLVEKVAAFRRTMAGSPGLPVKVASLQDLTGCDQTWTYKTTGAGGEDALLFFGDRDTFASLKDKLQEKGFVEASFGFGAEGAQINEKSLECSLA